MQPGPHDPSWADKLSQTPANFQGDPNTICLAHILVGMSALGTQCTQQKQRWRCSGVSAGRTSNRSLPSFRTGKRSAWSRLWGLPDRQAVFALCAWASPGWVSQDRGLPSTCTLIRQAHSPVSLTASPRPGLRLREFRAQTFSHTGDPGLRAVSWHHQQTVPQPDTLVKTGPTACAGHCTGVTPQNHGLNASHFLFWTQSQITG